MIYILIYIYIYLFIYLYSFCESKSPSVLYQDEAAQKRIIEVGRVRGASSLSEFWDS